MNLLRARPKSSVKHPNLQSRATIRPENDEELDLDAIINELESIDTHDEEKLLEDAVEEDKATAPEEDLNTDMLAGLTTEDSQDRIRRYGFNQLQEERLSLGGRQFLGFFVGPIQFVMEVSSPNWQTLIKEPLAAARRDSAAGSHVQLALADHCCRRQLFLLLDSKTG
jgi:magnesium-transporting ATPase (P-type)